MRSYQDMEINGQFKSIWKYFLHILSFLIEFHAVDYLTAQKPSLVSALCISSCPIGVQADHTTKLEASHS